MIALNIEMPKTCRECPCQDMNEEYANYCYAMYVMHPESTQFEIHRHSDEKPEWCPLIDLETR